MVICPQPEQLATTQPFFLLQECDERDEQWNLVHLGLTAALADWTTTGLVPD